MLQRLVDQGNSLVNLGPEGGVRGGEIVVEGKPEAVAANKRSYTGSYLKTLLARSSRACRRMLAR